MPTFELITDVLEIDGVVIAVEVEDLPADEQVQESGEEN